MPLEAIDIKDLPTPKEESWKYTNLPRAIPANLERVTNDEEEGIVHIRRGEICAKPVEVLFMGRDNGLHIDQLNITVEEGASVTVIEHHTGEGAYWKKRVTEINVADNAQLKHIRIQNDSVEAVNTNMTHITVGRDAVYDSFSLNMGGKLTRHEIHAVIEGTNAELSLNGVNMLKGAQHGDTTILIEHKAPHCVSNQFYRTLLDDEARGVFQGKVHVHKEAQRTDGYQLSNALLFSEKAEMDTKPELEIYADDVKCSHGATTGQLDEEPLFYLRSRGLTESEARRLLVEAFVDEVVDKVVDEDLNASLKEMTGQWLHDVL